MTREEIRRDLSEIRNIRSTRRTLEYTLDSYKKRLDKLLRYNNANKEVNRLNKVISELDAETKKLFEREVLLVKKHNIAIERLPVIDQRIVKRRIDGDTYESIGADMRYSAEWARWRFKRATIIMSTYQYTK